jgi:NTE family protein
MDGGMRSATNADMAKSFDLVFVVALGLGAGAGPNPMAEAFRKRLDGELDVLRNAGSRVELILPDAASLEAFGPNMMDYRRRPAAASAGLTRGRAIANGLHASWQTA